MGGVEESALLLDELMAIGSAEGAPLTRWIACANGIRRWSLRGDLAGAEAANDEALRLAQDLGQQDGTQWWGATAFGHAWLRGHAGDFAEPAGEFADQYPLGKVWRCAQAWALTEAGRHDEARAVVADHGLDPRELVVDVMPYVASFQLGIVAFNLGDAELAARVVEALEPYRDRWAHYYMFATGPITWTLGLARSAMGDHDRGVADLEVALATLEATGALAHVPTARVHFARALRARGAEGDAARAEEALTVARQEALALGALGLVDHIDALKR
jgi:hypothetical protein